MRMSTGEGAGGALAFGFCQANRKASSSSGCASSTDAPYLPFLICVMRPELISRSGLAFDERQAEQIEI
ncbi:hypothetical protein [Bradyrhizobium sp. STM 3562]|uniref:hypothetical protein n=1 Tax=Bradyrhizobium sp. STM 3562 TaxID=578924 RepID=UPI00388FE5BD